VHKEVIELHFARRAQLWNSLIDALIFTPSIIYGSKWNRNLSPCNLVHYFLNNQFKENDFVLNARFDRTLMHSDAKREMRARQECEYSFAYPHGVSIEKNIDNARYPDRVPPKLTDKSSVLLYFKCILLSVCSCFHFPLVTLFQACGQTCGRWEACKMATRLDSLGPQKDTTTLSSQI
jgi:hypothetical protein